MLQCVSRSTLALGHLPPGIVQGTCAKGSLRQMRNFHSVKRWDVLQDRGNASLRASSFSGPVPDASAVLDHKLRSQSSAYPQQTVSSNSGVLDGTREDLLLQHLPN